MSTVIRNSASITGRRDPPPWRTVRPRGHAIRSHVPRNFKIMRMSEHRTHPSVLFRNLLPTKIGPPYHRNGKAYILCASSFVIGCKQNQSPQPHEYGGYAAYGDGNF